MDIRLATPDDLDAVLDIHAQAFGHGAEAGLVEALLHDPSAQPSHSLIALKDSRCVGHILFTAATLVNAQAPVSASILAPLAVQPNHQSQGYGGGLIGAGLEVLRADGVDLVFVLGYPDYYGRFGFKPAIPHDLCPPYPIADEHRDAWMVLPLKDGVVGTVTGRVQCADALYRPEYWVK